MSVSEV